MSTVSYDDFAKLDFRVAKIIATEPIEGKSRIIKGTIDFYWLQTLMINHFG
jgi:tRNA-binding protein